MGREEGNGVIIWLDVIRGLQKDLRSRRRHEHYAIEESDPAGDGSFVYGVGRQGRRSDPTVHRHITDSGRAHLPRYRDVAGVDSVAFDG